MTLFVPAGSDKAWNVDAAESAAVPSVVVTPLMVSSNVTVPVGVPLPALTVAENVTLWPTLTGLLIGLRVVVVASEACTSYAPTSTVLLTIRAKAGPTLVGRQPCAPRPMSPAPIAGLPGNSATVWVLPPLFCSGPSSGIDREPLIPNWSPLATLKPLATVLS